MAATVMDLVVQMINALVIIVLMEIPPGLSLIALAEHALNMLPGLALLKMPTMRILSSNAPTKALATEKLANANALQITTELPVSVLFAQIDAVMLVFALRKSSLPQRPTVFTLLPGMPRSRSDACVILADAVLTAPCVSSQ